MLPSRPVWTEIDHHAIRFNYRQIRSYVKEGTEMLAVVKADAYGHGAVEAAPGHGPPRDYPLRYETLTQF